MTQASHQSTPFARRAFAMTCAVLLLAVLIGATRAESLEIEGARAQTVADSSIDS